MLFYGPPGTGKTSTILALAKQLFGPELFKTRVLELNASDERGISIVREKVKDFARTQLSHPPSGPAGVTYRAKYPCPPFKIIILDEADSMTSDAQAALRRTMESTARITRFCLVCNYVTRIIDPLASRCSKFRFKSLDVNDARRRLEEIAEKEAVRLESGVADELVRCSEGDLRKAITFLQSAGRLAGAVKPSKTKNGRKVSKQDEYGEDSDGNDVMDVDAAGKAVSVRTVEEIAGVIPEPVMDRLLKAMEPKGKGKSAPYDGIAAAITDMVADGWSATQVASQLYEKILFDERVSDLQKNSIVMIFSETDKRLVDGADEHLAMLDLALRVSSVLGRS